MQQNYSKVKLSLSIYLSTNMTRRNCGKTKINIWHCCCSLYSCHFKV